MDRSLNSVALSKSSVPSSRSRAMDAAVNAGAIHGRTKVRNQVTMLNTQTKGRPVIADASTISSE